MLTWNGLAGVCLAYAVFLFAIAFWAERRAAAGQLGWIRSPAVYTLSLSVYCTGWTFYGAVGSAARNGLEFVTIYLGPSLVFFGWWFLLRKLVRIGQTQRITSIADVISSRYGKSATLGVIVTMLAVIGTTPYIALQLQSLTLSISVLTDSTNPTTSEAARITGFWLALGLALFAILFGTRSIDANERHHGVVTAIAVEAVIKLIALLAVGIFVVWGLGTGSAELPLTDYKHIDSTVFTPRWVTLTFLSATAVLCLPRMFQVLVVENSEERHLATAAWAFPTYLFLISLFVLPIALAGQAFLPDGANPDLFVLTVPLSQGQDSLALLAFLGGFSAATSMVIVSAIALSTMISNHISVPIWLAFNKDRIETSGDVRNVVLMSRRVSIALILLLGYVYFLVTGGSGALASIGLISFAGIAQILPSLIGGMYWRGATRAGAISGIGVGFVVWAYTLFLPSFSGGFVLTESILQDGLFGFEMLRPNGLFGLTIDDPLVHTVYWSISLNTLAFVGISLMTEARPLERVQSAAFIDVFGGGSSNLMTGRSATSEDLFTLAQRILGTSTAHRLFTSVATAQGKTAGLPEADDALIQRVERELSGSVGSASAHAMVSQITLGGQMSVDQLIEMADETAQIVEYSHRLERQSQELEETAAELRQANTRLMEIGAQKDAFLSQVSHELRTPMTSIRSFAEILRSNADVPEAERQRFVNIINEESQRLTRLLDEILDLSFLESGRVRLEMEPMRIGDVIASAASSTEGLRHEAGVTLDVASDGLDHWVEADFDRLAQVLINLISNAVKYGKNEAPRVLISVEYQRDKLALHVCDNGPGIVPENHARAFEKFARLEEVTLAGSAGLGLPISREIMRNLGGELDLVPCATGAHFRLILRPAVASAPQRAEAISKG